MKSLFIILWLSVILLFTNCSNQKIKNLESENKQLKQQLDSCHFVALQQKRLADSASAIAIRQRVIADSAAAEARRQTDIARKMIQRKQ